MCVHKVLLITVCAFEFYRNNKLYLLLKFAYFTQLCGLKLLVLVLADPVHSFYQNKPVFPFLF